MIDYEKELNEQQYKAVKTIDGPILVLAGAGSGKTRTLTYRVSYLIEKGISPQNILLLTFTNKAAKEMIFKAQSILGGDFVLNGGTFHHMGNLILRRHANKIEREPNFTILDREDCKVLMRQVLDEKQISKDSFFPSIDVLLNILSLSASTQNSTENVLQEKWDYFLRVMEEINGVIECFEEKKKEINALTFDDLLLKWLYLLRKSKTVKAEAEDTFRYILVDEFQDTNKLQSLILDEITKENSNLMVVGDDAQSIYSFRGAEVNNILNFPKKYPNCEIFKLETNYRSTSQILDFADKIISQNENQFKKNLKAEKEGNKPIVFTVPDEKSQAQRIIYEILKSREDNLSLGQMAVLFRAGFESLEIELELAKHNIPYAKRGGLRFFETIHMKDILAFLKIEKNILDELSWRRVLLLMPGIGTKTASKIISKTKKEGEMPNVSFSPLINKEIGGLKNIFSKTGKEKEIDKKIRIILNDFYEKYLLKNFENGKERIDDILALMSFAAGRKDLNKFLDEVQSEESFQGEAKENKERLLLSTIHQAKGLEWDTVILIDVLENYLPNKRALEEPRGIEEERRLFYVALTRAKNRLYLFLPQSKKGFGGGLMETKPSRFIEEVSSDMYETKKEYLSYL